MARLITRKIQAAKPPYQLVVALGPGAHALDAGTANGWGSPIGGGSQRRSLLALDPELEFRGGLGVLEDARRWLHAELGQERWAACLIGWLSYDLGQDIQQIQAFAASSEASVGVRLAGFRAVYVFDPETQSGEVLGSDARAVRELAERIEHAASQAPAPAAGGLPAPVPRSPDAEFLSGVRAVQDWIRAGDVYQVNLSRCLDLKPVSRDQLPYLYERLTRQAPAPFSAFMDGGDQVVISNSPERFIRVVGDRIETCPIKGTRPRGLSEAEDDWQAKELLNSAKDRAEHVMIVDLERNDLGRICHTGSVHVRSMAELQRFSHVMHLVSSVEGRLIDPSDWLGLVRATFPGGSITGAPKLRAMQIIQELERTARGIYTGALGCFDAAGGIDLSIAIRTAIARNGEVTLHLGGGIVADSNPLDELNETRDKGRAFFELWGQEA